MKTLYEKVTRPVIGLWALGVALLLAATAVCTSLIFLPVLRELGEGMMRAKSEAISSFLCGQTEQLRRLGRMLDPADGMQANLYRLGFVAGSTDSYESLGIVDADGVVHVTSGVSFSIADRAYYQRMLTEEYDAVLSEPVGSRENDAMIVLILCALPDGFPDGVFVSGAINAQYIRHVLEQDNAFDFCTQLVRESDGRALISAGMDSGAGRVYCCPIEGWPGMLLRLVIPHTFLYLQTGLLILLMAVLSVIVCLMFSLLLRRMMIHTVAPINRLSSIMTGSSLGHLDRVEETSDVLEVVQLANSYNTMIDNTHALMEELAREERMKQDAEYRALIQQIKPHFLYNTLETIQSMCLTMQDDRVENAIGDLADYFRRSLGHDRIMVPLREELMQVEDYIRLQAMRFADRFDYEIRDETGGAVPFMRFTLQPIVENAIQHCVKFCSHREHIRIHCRQENGWLCVLVENTCEACDAETIRRIDALLAGNAPASEYPGYGLYNVSCRLRLHFGEQAGLRIQTDGHSVRVAVRHPLTSEMERTL